MNWKLTDAKQRFSEVVRRSAEEPQRIFSRDRLVAVVMQPDAFVTYERWKEARELRTVADAFTELRAICDEEDYELALPERQDRSNAFAEALDESAAR